MKKCLKVFSYAVNKKQARQFMLAHQKIILAGKLQGKEGILEYIRHVGCMNKAVLFVEMAKEAGVPARFHFMWVSKEALRELLHPLAYHFWPDSFIHTFPEVKLNGRWISMEATFDKELHEILLKKNLNFARYPHRRNISIEFSKSGIIGAQQLTAVEGRESIYADNLTPLKEMEETISWIKLKILRPWVLNLSRGNLEKLREG